MEIVYQNKIDNMEQTRLRRNTRATPNTNKTERSKRSIVGIDKSIDRTPTLERSQNYNVSIFNKIAIDYSQKSVLIAFRFDFRKLNNMEYSTFHRGISGLQAVNYFIEYNKKKYDIDWMFLTWNKFKNRLTPKSHVVKTNASAKNAELQNKRWQLITSDQIQNFQFALNSFDKAINTVKQKQDNPSVKNSPVIFGIHSLRKSPSSTQQINRIIQDLSPTSSPSQTVSVVVKRELFAYEDTIPPPLEMDVDEDTIPMNDPSRNDTLEEKEVDGEILFNALRYFIFFRVCLFFFLFFINLFFFVFLFFFNLFFFIF